MTTSTDGITWTTRTSGFGATTIRALTYGNNLYVAAGTAGVLTTSTNGLGALTSNYILNLTYFPPVIAS
jgi:hypothetical protein